MLSYKTKEEIFISSNEDLENFNNKVKEENLTFIEFWIVKRDHHFSFETTKRANYRINKSEEIIQVICKPEKSLPGEQ